jgi:hypothetical protein
MSTETITASRDDVDLLDLLERGGLFFRRYRWIFLIAAILGPGIGYFIYSKLPVVYKSRMILHSFTLSNQDYIEVVNNWNSLLKSKEYDLLAPSFDVPNNVLSSVKEMKANEIQKVFTAPNPNGFYIDVTITDNAILNSLQKGILNAMENIDFIKKQLTIKRENLTVLISEVQHEIDKLDSTKSKIERMLDSKTGHSSSLFVDISGLNKQRIELNEKLLYYQQDLKLANAVQVLQGFTRVNRPAGPNLVVWLGLGLIGFLGIAYIYSLFHSISRNLEARRNQEKKNGKRSS